MNEKLRAIIIEDEAPARELLKAFLKDFQQIDLVAECEDGFMGIKAVNEHNPDIIFLDIQMPKLTGFEMLELLDKYPEIIFTTAYDEFAIKAFEKNAVDYLMKPFSRQRFAQAVEKVYLHIKAKTKNKQTIQQLSKEIKQLRGSFSRIFVKTGTRIDIIPIEQIVRVEAQDDYVEIFTEKMKFLKKETMNTLEKNLPDTTFLRVHRSNIVNINHINKIEKYGKESYLLILKDGTRVNISKSRIKELKEQLGI